MQSVNEARQLIPGCVVMLALGLACGAAVPDAPVPDPHTTDMEPQVVEKIQEARQGVVKRPRSGDAWGHLGVVLHAHGLEDEAAAGYAQAALLEPTEFRWHYLPALLSRRADVAVAEVFVLRALEIDRGYAAAHVLLAEVLEQTGKAAAAADAYRNALALDPRCITAEFGLGRLRVEAGDLEGGLLHLERARALQQDARAVRAFLARVYHQLGRDEAARQEAKQAASLVADVRLHDPLADAIVEESVSTPGYLKRAARAERRQDPAAAEALYRTLVEMHPDDTSANYNMGNMLFRHGKLEQAEPFLRKAVRLDASHTSAHVILGSLLIAQGRDAQGVSHFEDPVVLRPEHTVLLNNLGTLLAREGRHEMAVYFLRRALEVAPGDASTHYNLGRSLANLGRFEDAILEFEAALAAGAVSGAVHRDLAYALVLVRRHADAWSHAHAAQDAGTALSPEFLQTLSQEMPDPG